MRSLSRDVARRALPLLALLLLPAGAEAQGRGKGRGEAPALVQVEISTTIEGRVREFYSARPAVDVEALPPGIRRRLEKGKPLPPGIAKKTVPAELRQTVQVPDGFELLEVGLDVFLVEVATSIVHDVLMDVVR